MTRGCCPKVGCAIHHPKHFDDTPDAIERAECILCRREQIQPDIARRLYRLLDCDIGADFPFRGGIAGLIGAVPRERADVVPTTTPFTYEPMGGETGGS